MGRRRDVAYEEDGTAAKLLGTHRLRRSDCLASRRGPVDAPHADSAAASRSLDQERIADFPPRILQPFEVAGLEPPASGDCGHPGRRSDVPGALLVAHFPDRPRRGSDPGEAGRLHRSEEHTSELQSLMRISYAVFCLTKKTYTTETDITTIIYYNTERE